MIRYVPTAIWVIGIVTMVLAWFATQDLGRVTFVVIGIVLFSVGICTDYLASKIDELIAAQPKKSVVAENQSTSTEK